MKTNEPPAESLKGSMSPKVLDAWVGLALSLYRTGSPSAALNMVGWVRVEELALWVLRAKKKDCLTLVEIIDLMDKTPKKQETEDE